LDQVFGLVELLKNIGWYMLLAMKGLISYKLAIITDISNKRAALPPFKRSANSPRLIFRSKEDMKYAKYHGLGNDYLVIRPNDVDGELESEKIQLICHRNYGVGSDGILLGPLPSNTCNFRLRILNPDGSEAETSPSGSLRTSPLP
jgi:hypothetical protein